MNFSNILPFLLGIPLAGILLIALGARPKSTALGVSILNLMAGALASGGVFHGRELIFGPDPTLAREVFPARFTLGLDGLSLPMIWLTLLVTVAAVASARQGIKREREYYICLLLVGLGALGAFLSVDLFYFFSFHEVALIPTFLLVGMWGHGDRTGAAWRMTVYLMLGSMILLVGLLGLYWALPETARSLDWRVLSETLRANPLSPGTQHGLAWLLMVGFGTLVALVPFHSWAPGGYASAPAPAAMLHAGVLKKFGLYGLMRLALPMVPDGWKELGWILSALLAANILYLGLASLDQRDFRWLLGFSSAMHMGTIFLGLVSGTVLGLAGALTLMVGHGLSAALGFAVAGEISRRTGTSWMRDLGGLAQRTPRLWFYLLVAAMASLGLPGLANFAGEIMIFFGAWNAHPVLVGIAAWGVVLSAVAMLRAVRAMAMGPMSPAVEAEGVTDIQGIREAWPLALLTLALAGVGVMPWLVVGPARPVLERLLLP